ncbi:MAG: GntR family transcriptional regulator [Rhizobiales bacterium]|nr:GntR family transcriptional regulator [Hyphomicrobiales bacterium]
MRKIKRESLTDQVLDILQGEIDAGRIAPGARIVEERIAEQLGVSKTPLRLALHQLKQDGIVRIEARQGIYLAIPTPGEVAELVEIREVMEGLAARRLARAAHKSIVAALRECFSGFTETNVNDKRSKFATADHAFHRQLVTLAGSRELTRVMSVVNLRLHMNRLRHIVSRGHDLRPLHKEHMAIIAAIGSGDAQKAELLGRAHVRNVPWQTILREIGGPLSPAPSVTAA